MGISQVYVSREIVREIMVDGNGTAPWIFGFFLVFLGVNVGIHVKGQETEDDLCDAFFHGSVLLFRGFDKEHEQKLAPVEGVLRFFVVRDL